MATMREQIEALRASLVEERGDIDATLATIDQFEAKAAALRATLDDYETARAAMLDATEAWLARMGVPLPDPNADPAGDADG